MEQLRGGKAVDQVARDMAREAKASIERLEAIFTRSEKTIEDGIRRVQQSYETGQADLSQRHSVAINTISKNMGDMFMQQEKAVNGLMQRDVEMAQTLGRIEGKLDGFITRFERHEVSDASVAKAHDEKQDEVDKKLGAISDFQVAQKGGNRMLAIVGTIAATVGAGITQLANMFFSQHH